MPTLREIKGHMNSVRSIAKVTRAMEMVSSAKSRRLRARMESARLFADKSWQVLNHLAAAAEDQVRDHPIFCGQPEVKRLGLLLITSDRGMVGTYNHEIIALALQVIHERGVPVEVITLGKVGREAMLRAGHSVHADFHLDDSADVTALTPVARVVLDGFTHRTFDEVWLAYTHVQTGARTQPTLRQLLPICHTETAVVRQYLYEPDPRELLLALLPRLIRFQLYQALLEAWTAENTARMVAMHAATQNAYELIEQLTLSYNKARQQAITAELTDIVTGTAVLGER